MTNARIQAKSRAVPPMYVSVELLANLLYLAGRSDTRRNQQRRYVDWAVDIVDELQHHPEVRNLLP